MFRVLRTLVICHFGRELTRKREGFTTERVLVSDERPPVTSRIAPQHRVASRKLRRYRVLEVLLLCCALQFVGCVRDQLTLPSECVSLNRPGFEDLIHPRHRRGGGNVGIGFIDFQGLWEGRKTAPSFSGLPTNRHFHGLLRSPRTLRRRSSP